MKFRASASFRRSARMATILRLVALAISFAVFSSGSLRRAQMATSTPSLASASAMPLPMPSEPPVTSAVLPLSLRSIAILPLYLAGHLFRFPNAQHQLPAIQDDGNEEDGIRERHQIKAHNSDRLSAAPPA